MRRASSDGDNISLAGNGSGQLIVFVGDRENANASTAFARSGLAVSNARPMDAYRLSLDADKVVGVPIHPPDHLNQTCAVCQGYPGSISFGPSGPGPVLYSSAFFS